jgi:hypothetical protein
MPRIGLWFILLAGLCLMVGVYLGMWMGVNKDFTLAPVHAHLNLLGWASLALFGLTYSAYPEIGRTRLAVCHFALAAPSAMLFPYAIYRAIVLDDGSLSRIAAPMWFLGVLLFVIAVGRAALAREKAAAGLPAAA